MDDDGEKQTKGNVHISETEAWHEKERTGRGGKEKKIQKIPGKKIKDKQ